MTTIVPITKFRENLFEYADYVAKTGVELEVEKNGISLFRVVKTRDDPKERARRILKVLPKLAGIWADVPEEKFKEMNEFMRGKKEIEYMKNLEKKWTRKIKTK